MDNGCSTSEHKIANIKSCKYIVSLQNGTISIYCQINFCPYLRHDKNILDELQHILRHNALRILSPRNFECKPGDFWQVWAFIVSQQDTYLAYARPYLGIQVSRYQFNYHIYAVRKDTNQEKGRISFTMLIPIILSHFIDGRGINYPCLRLSLILSQDSNNFFFQSTS